MVLACLILAMILLFCLVIIALLLHSTFCSVRKEKESWLQLLARQQELE